ncbi:hypothetical protein K1X13_14415 [Nocardioides sp. WL0053]|uniref:Uncharacterized protein n=1 Tax=Nocardioides jiangsuensis TaxID=2866161 RepID=A0ABS7RLV9_9ACTN|nr:hypothetical protein [Nocardioides jiangsuensis]MBY9076025.1 hypothetical protein [Nocardioides jiangsuensis]
MCTLHTDLSPLAATLGDVGDAPAGPAGSRASPPTRGDPTLDLVETLGHIDLRTAQPTSAVVLRSASEGSRSAPEGTRAHREGTLRITCQACGWWQARPTIALACRSRDAHACGFTEENVYADARTIRLLLWAERELGLPRVSTPAPAAFVLRLRELAAQHRADGLDRDEMRALLRREFPDQWPE